MVECQLPKLDVAGSSPVSRSRLDPPTLCPLWGNPDSRRALRYRRTTGPPCNDVATVNRRKRNLSLPPARVCGGGNSRQIGKPHERTAIRLGPLGVLSRKSASAEAWVWVQNLPGPLAPLFRVRERQPSQSPIGVPASRAEFRWRRERDSNPRYGFPYTRFPSVRLQPLGHLSPSS